MDIMAVLYGRILRHDPARPDWPERDRFILSKGHAAAGLYAVLGETGYFDPERLTDYCRDGSCFSGHATVGVPGVEVSTGSLGHGLPIGAGMALAAQRDGRPGRVFVLTGDGELGEGSNWEAALLAAQLGLQNLVLIVDHNKLQCFGRVDEVLNLAPLADKWRAFGWYAAEVDGHDHDALATLFSRLPLAAGRPTAVIAHTVKGKGVSYMEDCLAWHFQSPDAAQLEQALAEVGDADA